MYNTNWDGPCPPPFYLWGGNTIYNIYMAKVGQAVPPYYPLPLAHPAPPHHLAHMLRGIISTVLGLQVL